MAEPVVYDNLGQLIARINAHMTENHNNENTGTRTNQLLQEIVLGLLAIIGNAPTGVASIQPWDNGAEYTDQVIVSHNGFLWLFVGGSDTGTQPGTDNDIWIGLGTAVVPQLSQVLAAGERTGANDIGVDAGQKIVFRDTESEGKLKLYHEPITDNNELKLPNKSGVLATVGDLTDLNLKEVLVNGNETDGRSITVSEFDGINFEQGANMVRLKAPTTANDLRTLLLPDKSGTVATTDDVNAVALLVDGTMRAPEAFAPSGSYPATYGGNPIQKGDTFRLAAGTMGLVEVNAEDLLIALVDVPGQTDANWQVIESNRVTATQAEAEDSGSEDLAKLMPPKRWWQAWTKGLSLAAFGNAVRGMLLTGYAAGANAAIVAGDSVLTAFGKIQAQLNGKLAKKSDLDDLNDKGVARMNLGLGSLATKSILDVLQTEVVQPGHGLSACDIVDYDNSLGWVKADQRPLAMVIAVDGDVFKLVLHGMCKHASFDGVVVPGSSYYLAGNGKYHDSPDGPFVFTAFREGEIYFAPQWSVDPSGRMVLAATVETTVETRNGGKNTGLGFLSLDAGRYHVRVYARVKLTSAGERKVLVGLSGADLVVCTYTAEYHANGGLAEVNAMHDAWGSLANDVDPDEPLLHVIDGIVTVPSHSILSVVVGNNDDVTPVSMLAGSVFMWEKVD